MALEQESIGRDLCSVGTHGKGLGCEGVSGQLVGIGVTGHYFKTVDAINL